MLEDKRKEVDYMAVIPSLKGAFSLHGGGKVGRLTIEFSIEDYPEVLTVLPQLMGHQIAVTMSKGIEVPAGEVTPAVFI